MSLPIYLRKTPMTYTIINSFTRKDPDTGMSTQTQGIFADFTNSQPGQVATFDPNRSVANYIRNEITSGRIDPEDEDKKTEWLEGIIRKFIEKHRDFNKDGTGVIWEAPTKQDIKDGLEERKRMLEAEIKSLGEIEVTDESVADAVDKAGKEVNTATKKMVFGGGISTGGSTTANKR